MTTDTTTSDRYDVEPVNSKKRRPQLYAPRKKIFPKRASGQLRGTPSQYFIGAVMRSFKEAGLGWEGAPRKPT